VTYYEVYIDYWQQQSWYKCSLLINFIDLGVGLNALYGLVTRDSMLKECISTKIEGIKNVRQQL